MALLKEGGKKVVPLSSNKKAQGNLFFLLMIGVVFFILGLALTPMLTDAVSESTTTAQLNCSNVSSLSDQDKANCTSWDILPFLYLGAIFGLMGVVLAGAFLR